MPTAVVTDDDLPDQAVERNGFATLSTRIGDGLTPATARSVPEESGRHRVRRSGTRQESLLTAPADVSDPAEDDGSDDAHRSVHLQRGVAP